MENINFSQWFDRIKVYKDTEMGYEDCLIGLKEDTVIFWDYVFGKEININGIMFKQWIE